MTTTPKRVKFVAFDPGLRTGIAAWNSEGVISIIHKTVHGDAALDEFLDSLEVEEPDVFIIEEYRVYGSNLKANVGSKVHTAQVIGCLKAWARRHKVIVVEQRSDIKEVAALWSGTELPPKHKRKNWHMPDWMAAYLHGYYYLHNIGLIKPRILERRNSDL
jgi:hypothetical protein